MKVKLVYGCPCSGKTTYCLSNAGNDDLIYDFDRLVLASTTRTQHLTEHHAGHNVLMSLRKDMVDRAKEDGAVGVMWVCARWPTENIMSMFDGLEVEQIFIRATKQECMEHLESDDMRPDKDAWKAVINDWFDAHGEPENGGKEYMKKFWNWIRDQDTGERTLRLSGPIAEESWWGDEVTPADFRAELNDGTGPISVWINSPGGDVFAAAQIYNMLMDYPFDVTVKIDGIAASAASVIAMAGTEVHMSPVSMLMIHNPSTAVWGDSEEMKKAIKTLDEVKESIINAYEIKTGLSRDKISHMMDAETWMNANKAVELGFADKILFEQEQEGGETVAMAFTPMTVTNSIRSKVALKEPVKDEHRVSADALEQRLNLLRH